MTRAAKPAARAGRATPAAPESPVLEGLFAEAYRLRLLRGFEEMLARCGYARIAGVDEVGRGSLAGPVVAAAVVVDPRCLVPGVDDSKHVAAPDRERIARAIRDSCFAVAVAQIPPDVIDRVNILEATRQAMCQALRSLRPEPDCAVVDAVTLRGFRFPCVPIVRGDTLSYAVACASIVAKVERDRMMTELHDRYPQYGFASHKGYSVPEHMEALAVYGPSPVHRLTFRQVVPRTEARC